MHGSLGVVQKLSSVADVHEVELNSGRSALHKAAFWGHEGTIEFLLNTCKLDANVQDVNGDTALHDAARFGHTRCVQMLLPATDRALRNKDGKTAIEVAVQYKQDKIVSLIELFERTHEKSKL